MASPSTVASPSALVAQLAADFGRRPGALAPTALVQEAESTLCGISPSVAPVLRLLDACGVAPDELHGELVSAGAEQLRGGPVLRGEEELSLLPHPFLPPPSQLGCRALQQPSGKLCWQSS